MRFSILGSVSRFMPFDLLNSAIKPDILPVFYHAVGNKAELPYLRNLYTIPDPSRFESDLDFLLKKYTPISLNELIELKKTGSGSLNKQYLFLTFDDGLSVTREIIAPILLRKGIPACFFVNSGFIGNENFLHRFKIVLMSNEILERNSRNDLEVCSSETGKMFKNTRELSGFIMSLRYPQLAMINQLSAALNPGFDSKLKEYKPYLTRNEIEELIHMGFAIGAHSEHHPEFYLLSEEEQLKEACQSILQLEEWFSLPHRVFAFPFTDHGISSAFFAKLHEQCQPELTFGCAGLKKDSVPNHIQRISLDDTMLSAKNRLKAEFLYYCLKAPIGKNTLRRR